MVTNTLSFFFFFKNNKDQTTADKTALLSGEKSDLTKDYTCVA